MIPHMSVSLASEARSCKQASACAHPLLGWELQGAVQFSKQDVHRLQSTSMHAPTLLGFSHMCIASCGDPHV